MEKIIYNLQEDNEAILNLIQYVEVKIVELRKNNKLSPPVLQDLQKLYNGAIDDWMKYNYLSDVEPDPRWENEIRDNLIDILSYLKTL